MRRGRSDGAINSIREADAKVRIICEIEEELIELLSFKI
jgi:hypothetical protein